MGVTVNDLPPDAVAHLYPVLAILALALGSLGALVAGLWVGFRWLHGQIEDTSGRMIAPIETRVALVEKVADAAHRRLDELMGRTP